LRRRKKAAFAHGAGVRRAASDSGTPARTRPLTICHAGYRHRRPTSTARRRPLRRPLSTAWRVTPSRRPASAGESDPPSAPSIRSFASTPRSWAPTRGEVSPNRSSTVELKAAARSTSSSTGARANRRSAGGDISDRARYKADAPRPSAALRSRPPDFGRPLLPPRRRSCVKDVPSLETVIENGSLPNSSMIMNSYFVNLSPAGPLTGAPPGC
jgi:hypothetical protein